MTSATTAESTAPREKKAERAVTRYCLLLGMFSSRRVPSVGIDPYETSISVEKMHDVMRLRTPTALPRNTKVTQSRGKDGAKTAVKPNTAVRTRVPLNAAIRPSKSEPDPSLEWSALRKKET
jgi:hypothetical protein